VTNAAGTMWAGRPRGEEDPERVVECFVERLAGRSGTT